MVETIESKFHDRLIKGSIRVENGFISAPQEAGLGIKVDEALARANTFNGKGLHLEMQDKPCDYQRPNAFVGGAPAKD